jgi:hypothetical protein
MKPKSKAERLRDTDAYAEGGSTRMLKQQAAGPARAGQTGKQQTAAPGAKAAKGGPPTRGTSAVLPAAAGHTAPPRKSR